MFKICFVVFSILLLFLASCNEPAEIGEEEDEVPVYIPQTEYGIVTDSLLVVKDYVKKNEFLADILLNYHVDYATIDHIARHTKDTFDVRKIRVGNKYTLLCTDDSIQKALYFIYEINSTDYVVYRFDDSVSVSRGKKDINIQMASVSGVIESSLWNSLVASDSDPNLANELSEIYAWTIDFFGLRKKDAYKVIYEELSVDGKYIGIGRVYAAMFKHMGDERYAFYFIQDSTGDYFDEEGNSLQRTFLKAPLRYTRISSTFSNSRLHPVLKIRRPHHGVDYAAPTGTPVYTVGDGVVTQTGYQKKGGGNYVKIKHNGTYSTTYMHLSGFAKGIKQGKTVRQGELIGYVGATGLATGPHLDFRFYRNGEAVDPLKVESPPSKPVFPENRPEFDSLVNVYKARIDSIQ